MSARQLITSWKTWLCRSVFFFLFFFPPRFYNPPCVLLKRPCAHSRRETLMRSGAFASLLPQPSVCRLPAAAGNNAASVPAQRWRVHRCEPSNKPHILYFFALNCTLYNPHYPPPHQSISEHFRVDCRLPEQALASGNSPFAPTKEVVICGEILLYAAVLGAGGETVFEARGPLKV